MIRGSLERKPIVELIGNLLTSSTTRDTCYNQKKYFILFRKLFFPWILHYFLRNHSIKKIKYYTALLNEIIKVIVILMVIMVGNHFIAAFLSIGRRYIRNIYQTLN
jgi:hypothetical protein